ncbi:MAG: T9SS type A sorting domain-containing protein [Vicingus serpentipes]|nr:T9SS type A sorting domain-containing protein [Vicingus serpentipes]
MKRIFTFLFAVSLTLAYSVSAQNTNSAANPGDAAVNTKLNNTNNKATILEQQVSTIGSGMVVGSYPSMPAGNDIVQGAEDFVVPANTRWEIDSITVQMYWNNSQADRYDVLFYEDNAGKPGTLKYANTGATFNLPNPLTLYNMNFNIDENVNKFTPGRYWVSVQPTYDTVTNVSNGITYWRRDTVVTSGLSAKIKDSIPVVFGAVRDWGSVTYYPSGVLTNLAFTLRGVAINTTGVNELAYKNGSISAYPNPAENQITFAITNVAITNINIYDVTGSLVETISMNNKSSVVHNLEKYESGVYFYKSLGNDNELIGAGKFIVK